MFVALGKVNNGTFIEFVERIDKATMMPGRMTGRWLSLASPAYVLAQGLAFDYWRA